MSNYVCSSFDEMFFLSYTSIMPVLRSEFSGLENTSYRQRLRVLSALKYSAFNLYQQISSISFGKKKAESNFININRDLN